MSKYTLSKNSEFLETKDNSEKSLSQKEIIKKTIETFAPTTDEQIDLEQVASLIESLAQEEQPDFEMADDNLEYNPTVEVLDGEMEYISSGEEDNLKLEDFETVRSYSNVSE